MQQIRAREGPPSFAYVVNGRQRTMVYYVAEGIYPSWAILTKTIQNRTAQKEEPFEKAQEAITKDIERAIGVLVTRFHNLKYHSGLWKKSDLCNVMMP